METVIVWSLSPWKPVPTRDGWWGVVLYFGEGPLPVIRRNHGGLERSLYRSLAVEMQPVRRCCTLLLQSPATWKLHNEDTAPHFNMDLCSSTLHAQWKQKSSLGTHQAAALRNLPASAICNLLLASLLCCVCATAYIFLMLLHKFYIIEACCFSVFDWSSLYQCKKMLVKVKKQKKRRKDCDKDSSKIESKNRAADVSVSLQMEDIVWFCCYG